MQRSARRRDMIEGDTDVGSVHASPISESGQDDAGAPPTLASDPGSTQTVTRSPVSLDQPPDTQLRTPARPPTWPRRCCAAPLGGLVPMPAGGPLALRMAVQPTLRRRPRTVGGAAGGVAQACTAAALV